MSDGELKLVPCYVCGSSGSVGINIFNGLASVKCSTCGNCVIQHASETRAIQVWNWTQNQCTHNGLECDGCGNERTVAQCVAETLDNRGFIAPFTNMSAEDCDRARSKLKEIVEASKKGVKE
jgi:hypothetical protein